jgi:hypothetical protein
MPAHDVPVHAAGELGAQPTGRHAFEAVHQPGHGDLWRVRDEKVYVVILPVEFAQFGSEAATDLPHDILAAVEHVGIDHAAPVCRRKDQVHNAMRKLRACHAATPVMALDCRTPLLRWAP